MNTAQQHKSSVVGPALEKILHAAEAEFAEKGFDGAGMKSLSVRAGVSQSLLHYHFGSKDRLYEAVIRERSGLINTDRLERLGAVDRHAADAVQRIVEALFVPALGPRGGGCTYARIFAGLIAGNERDRALVRECYDPTAMTFIDALESSLGAGRDIAAQVYQFALGVLASVIARDGRVERLMGDESARLDDDALIRQVTLFVVGGAEAIAQLHTTRGSHL